MHALVVYESMFGNTQIIAEGIADGLATRVDVSIVNVGNAPARIPEDVDLLVVGGPTHALGMSRPATRQNAAQQTESTTTPVATGIREWLEQLGSITVPLAATFDTRIRKWYLPGSAARAIARRLSRSGAAGKVSSATFWVTGTAGPLGAGERERAKQWGQDLGDLTRARGPVNRIRAATISANPDPPDAGS